MQEMKEMLIRSLNGEDLLQKEMESPPVFLMGESNGQKSQWATVHWVTKESDSVESLSNELEMYTTENYSYF